MQMVVIGLGSMGKRRIRLLHDLNRNIELYGVDSRKDRRDEVYDLAKKQGIDIRVFSDIEEIPQESAINAAMICTSPLSHNALIKACLKRGYNVFSEINLVSDGYDENIQMADKMERILYLSSTPMFKKEVRYISDKVSTYEGQLNYIYHIGQYLPDWHPWEYYNDFFIGDKRTNGCREILAIELPWIISAFGEIENVVSEKLKQTSLDIDYPDCINILISHKSGHKGVVTTDVVCRRAVRNIEVYGENLYMKWNGKYDGLSEFNIEKNAFDAVDLYDAVEQHAGYNDLIVEDAYKEEIKDFLDVLCRKKTIQYTFKMDEDTLKWIDKIESC